MDKMINIKLKNKLSKTIKVGEVELTIDYPNIEQHERLNEILLQSVFLDSEIKKETDSVKIAQLQAKKFSLFNDYMRLFLRYTIKGINGLDYKVNLVNNELDDESYEAICYDIEQVKALFNIIYEELDFNDTDKKKL